MSMMCLAAARTTPVKVVGLCHSVQGSGHLLAKRAGVPYSDMTWECAGINHLAWFTKLEHHGKDLYPLLMKKAQQDLAGKPSDPKDLDLVRKDMMLHFGAFITESSGHLSEYLPYYRKRKDLLKTYGRPGYDGETSFYANNWPDWRKSADRTRMEMISGKQPIDWERSWEYASWIIEGREKDVPVRIHGNVYNNVDGVGTLITTCQPTAAWRWRASSTATASTRHATASCRRRWRRCAHPTWRCSTLAPPQPSSAARKRHPLLDARSAHRRCLLAGRDQGDDAGVVRGREGLPAEVQ